VKLTWILHEVAGASVTGQKLVTAKFPVALMLLMFRDASPVLVRVAVCEEVVFTFCAPNTSLDVRTATGATPVPVSATVFTAEVLLLASVNTPFAVPLATGKNVTLMKQVAPETSVAGQLFDSANGPVMLMPVICSGRLPELVNTIVCAALWICTLWLPKFQAAGEKLAAGTAPCPVRPAEKTVPLAFSANVPVLNPLAEGVKVTWAVQLAPLAKTAGQSLLCVKSPVTVIPDTATHPCVAWIVNDWLGLVEPTGCDPKPKEAGASVADGVLLRMNSYAPISTVLLQVAALPDETR